MQEPCQGIKLKQDKELMKELEKRRQWEQAIFVQGLAYGVTIVSREGIDVARYAIVRFLDAWNLSEDMDKAAYAYMSEYVKNALGVKE